MNDSRTIKILNVVWDAFELEGSDDMKKGVEAIECLALIQFALGCIIVDADKSAAFLERTLVPYWQECAGDAPDVVWSFGTNGEGGGNELN